MIRLITSICGITIILITLSFMTDNNAEAGRFLYLKQGQASCASQVERVAVFRRAPVRTMLQRAKARRVSRLYQAKSASCAGLVQQRASCSGN